MEPIHLKYNKRKEHPDWKSKTELKKLKLMPGSEPVAFCFMRHGSKTYYLYELSKSIPYAISEEEKAISKQKRAVRIKKLTCNHCGQVMKRSYEIFPIHVIEHGFMVEKNFCIKCYDEYEEKQRTLKNQLRLDGIRDILDGNSVIIDCETTGLDPVKDRIIEMSIISMDGSVLYNKMFNPLINISYGAYAVHGISNDDVLNLPPMTQEDIFDIQAAIGSNTIAGYNVQFDLDMLYYSFERNNVRWPYENHYTYCVMHEMSDFMGIEYFLSLQKAYDCFFKTKPQTHRSLDDCRMTLSVLNKIREQLI